MMRQEEKSTRETVIECMLLEELEWSISIAEEGEVQECGDVIFLTVMVYSRASTSTLPLLRQVFGCVGGVSCLYWTAPTAHRSAVISIHLLHSGV